MQLDDKAVHRIINKYLDKEEQKKADREEEDRQDRVNVLNALDELNRQKHETSF